MPFQGPLAQCVDPVLGRHPGFDRPIEPVERAVGVGGTTITGIGENIAIGVGNRRAVHAGQPVGAVSVHIGLVDAACQVAGSVAVGVVGELLVGTACRDRQQPRQLVVGIGLGQRGVGVVGDAADFVVGAVAVTKPLPFWCSARSYGGPDRRTGYATARCRRSSS